MFPLSHCLACVFYGQWERIYAGGGTVDSSVLGTPCGRGEAGRRFNLVPVLRKIWNDWFGSSPHHPILKAMSAALPLWMPPHTRNTNSHPYITGHIRQPPRFLSCSSHGPHLPYLRNNVVLCILTWRGSISVKIHPPLPESLT